MSAPAEHSDIDLVEIDAWRLAALAMVMEETVAQIEQGNRQPEVIDLVGKLEALASVIREKTEKLATDITSLPPQA